jgi:hypothetical protein
MFRDTALFLLRRLTPYLPPAIISSQVLAVGIGWGIRKGEGGVPHAHWTNHVRAPAGPDWAILPGTAPPHRQETLSREMVKGKF